MVGAERNAGLREAFATTEAALSLLLLIGAILMLRSFSNLRGVDPGFRADHVLALRVNVPDSRYGSFTKRAEFFDRVLERARAVRRMIWSIDRNQPVSDIQTLDDLLDNEVLQQRLQARLLGGFAALALALACVGMYGVLAYLVTQRTKEIGVRLALGADTRDILRTVAGRGMMLAGSGISIGILGGLALSRLLSSMLFGISGRDPVIYASAVAIFAGMALAACSIPAMKASRIDPVLALRNE